MLNLIVDLWESAYSFIFVWPSDGKISWHERFCCSHAILIIQGLHANIRLCCIALPGIKVEGINHSTNLWFYTVQGLFAAVFEHLDLNAQRDCLLKLKVPSYDLCSNSVDEGKWTSVKCSLGPADKQPVFTSKCISRKEHFLVDINVCKVRVVNATQCQYD